VNRKIIIITILYIIGTLGGLYLYKNIIPFLLGIVMFFVLLTKKNKTVYVFIILIAYARAGITCGYVDNLENIDNVRIIGDVIKVTERANGYTIDIKASTINEQRTKVNTVVRAYSKNNQNVTVGEKISVKGKKYTIAYTKNSGCFDYKMYMKSKKIFCTIEVEEISKSRYTIWNYVLSVIDFFRMQIRKNIKAFLPERNAGICIALIIGEKNEIDEYDTKNFSDSGLSHIIAISGMHTVYISSIALLFKKVLGKRKSYILAIILLVIFCNLTYNTESVLRATIMLILFFGSKLLFRKSDSLSSLFFSILICLINNPFCIYNSSLIFSCAGTFGIIIMYEEHNGKNKIKSYVINQIKLSLSANLVLIPIVAKMYNRVSLNFFISSSIVNLIISALMPCLLLYSICSILSPILPVIIFKIIAIILKILSNFLLSIADYLANIDVLNLNVGISSLLLIFIYYIFLYIIYKRSAKNNIDIKKIAVKLGSIYLMLCIIFYGSKYLLSNNLKIYFVDVGQGDCTFIVTPRHHTILIDGGGKEGADNINSIGNRVLIPYLRNKGIFKIDYIFISHFDTDHVGGVLDVIQEFEIGNIIITKQEQECLNYQKFCSIVNQKRAKVSIVEMGNRIVIEDDISFDILWPEKNIINENILNNNAMVCKLNYKNFSMLFTGDIEAISEKRIISINKNNLNVLKSTCLKASHHGSKTSSIKEFVDAVKPQYVLIGVGVGNKFGHPNKDVVEYYKEIRSAGLQNRFWWRNCYWGKTWWKC